MKKIILFTLFYIFSFYAAPENMGPVETGPIQPIHRITSKNSEDTGYDSRTPTSSQSSVHVEIGIPLEEFVPQTPILFDENQMDDDPEQEDDVNASAPMQVANAEAAQPTLVDVIDHTYYNTPPLWFWKESEVRALGHLKKLAQEKRAFKNHAKAWVRKHLGRYLNTENSRALVNIIFDMIDNSANDYWQRKRSLLLKLNAAGVPIKNINKFDVEVLTPHEKKCKDQVARCAKLIEAFSGIEGVAPIKERYKLLPDAMIRTVLQNITNTVNGQA